jgi:hypothetical protein
MNLPTEIIPANPLPLPGFETALSTMDTLESSLAPLAERAKVIAVTDAQSFAEAGEIIRLLKNVQNDSETTMQPFKNKVNQVKDWIQQRFMRNKNRAQEIHAHLTAKMADYSRKEREAAEKEQKELNKKLERRGEEPVTVQPNIPKVVGVRNTVNYPITIEDSKALIKACLKAYKATNTERFQFLAQFIKLDESALAAHAKDLKDPEQFAKDCPGVKCEKREAFGGKV